MSTSKMPLSGKTFHSPLIATHPHPRRPRRVWAIPPVYAMKENMIQVFNVHAARPSVQWNWLSLAGPDAQDFLHRLTTVDVRNLQPGEGAPGFFLNPQGKVRSYFTLWCIAPQDFAFEYEAGATGHWKQELLATIDQYTFAEKITLTDVTADTGLGGSAGHPPLECRWLFAEPSALRVPALEALHTVADEEEIRLCHHGMKDYGRTWMTAWGRPARLAQWLDRVAPDAEIIDRPQLDAWRIESLRPAVDHEITPATIPLEVGLMEGLAQGKGCYPGQEVIERIVSLGAPARRLAKMTGTGQLPEIGESIVNLAEPPIEVGQVTSISPSRGGPGQVTDHFTVLGFIRKIHAKEGLEVRFARTGSQAKLTGIAAYAE
jgi:folate-binding protein YgfZ